MSNESIERTENRQQMGKTWKIMDKDNGHYINVVFSKELEDNMKKHSQSFERFQSEQINAILKWVNNLDHDYILNVTEENVGKANMPLSAEKLAEAIELI